MTLLLPLLAPASSWVCSAEEQEQRELELFLARAARTPGLQARLKRLDPYEVVELAAAEGFHFGVFTVHWAVCTGFVMPKVRQ